MVEYASREFVKDYVDEWEARYTPRLMRAIQDINVELITTAVTTLSDQISKLGEAMHSGFQAITVRLDTIDTRLEKIEEDIHNIKEFVGYNKVRH